MTANHDALQASIRQLETCLLVDDILHESESHPLFILRNQLQEIDCRIRSSTVDEQQKLLSDLYSLEISCLCQLLRRFSSTIPPSMIKLLLETIRYQMNISMTVNSALADHYFDFSCAYLTIPSTIQYLQNTNNNMPADLDELLLELFASIGARAVHIKTNLSYSICVSHQNVPGFFQFTPTSESLLRALIVYLNRHFFDRSQQQQHSSHSFVLQWLVNLSNVYGFVPFFVKTEYPNAVLQWLTITRAEAEHISLNDWFQVLNLLHNLARHRMGVKPLNKLKAIAILKQWRDQYISTLVSLQNDENDKNIVVAYHLVYANLLEPRELKKEDMSHIQTALDYIVERTVQAFNSPDLCFGSYSICEYLKGLAKLVVNDQFLVSVMSRLPLFELFVEKFLLFNASFPSTDLNAIICSSLYTIFWSVSFQAEYHAKLKSIDRFVQYVEQTATMDSDDELAVMIKRAAKGILFNLDLIQIDVQPIEENTNEKNPNQTKVMVSYAHKDVSFCQKLVGSLQERLPGDVWVDFDKLAGPYEDNWEEIAIAITQCDVILMIVTENYCSSKSCRREVIHADKRNKRMIPIYQGKDYKADDWFEIRVGSAIWVRFGDKRSDDEVMKTLFGLINAQDTKKPVELKIAPSPEPPPHTVVAVDRQVSLAPPPTPVAHSAASPVEQWTAEEVQQWLQLPPTVLQLSSGQALLMYMNLLAQPDAQRDEYEHRMRSHGVSRERFANLIASFSTIRSTAQLDATKPPERWTQAEVNGWFQQQRLSAALADTFAFSDGSQLVAYARLVNTSALSTNDEYERLRDQIGQAAFDRDEYTRLLNALKTLARTSTSEVERAV